jgi:hypothetical protein
MVKNKHNKTIKNDLQYHPYGEINHFVYKILKLLLKIWIQPTKHFFSYRATKIGLEYVHTTYLKQEFHLVNFVLFVQLNNNNNNNNLETFRHRS